MTTTSTPEATGTGGFLRRNRIAVGLGVAVLAALLLVTWLGRDSAGRGGLLDPENPRPGGARAVARVLADLGIEVDVVRGRDSFDRARLDGRTTVVVSNPDELARSTFRDLDGRLRSADGAVLVIIGVGPVVADGFGLPTHDFSGIASGSRTPADCRPKDSLLDGLTLTAADADLGVAGDGCFGDPGLRLLHVDRASHRWLLLVGSPVSNKEIDRDDNAAVALRLLGQRDRVLWYVADSSDAPAEGVAVSRLVPRWLVPAVWLLGIVAIALLLQRGRRLGPLVVEPVPVTIKALETTTSLGRLYEKARDRGHAAGLLVDGTVARLVVLLGVDPTVDRDELVRAVAARTGRPLDAVAALLPLAAAARDRVRSDTDLVALAQDLTHLEEEVRRA